MLQIGDRVRQNFNGMSGTIVDVVEPGKRYYVKLGRHQQVWSCTSFEITALSKTAAKSNISANQDPQIA